MIVQDISASYPVDCGTVHPLYNGSTCVPTQHHSPCIHQHQLVAAPLYLQEGGKNASIKVAKNNYSIIITHNVQSDDRNAIIKVFRKQILIKTLTLTISICI